MNFGQALEELKAGNLVTRKGWNGKNMFLWLKPATKIKEEWCKDPILLRICQDNGGEVDALGTICMKTADNKVLTGWLASQTDMLSDDWELYWEAPELKEKDMDFEYKTFIEKNSNNIKQGVEDTVRLRKTMGIGVTEEEQAETHEKIQSTSNMLSANIQRDVLWVLNHTGDKKEYALNQLKEKYMLEAQTDEEKIFVASQFETFLDYVRNQ